ncbi:hypothetical protein HJ590_14605 [Naumannella sp. ID2617S]|nr:hypothetical protein [Naumannella sp. ID2617S]
MSMIVKQPLTGPATWRGADLAGVTDWLHVLSADELDELDRALAHVRDAGRMPPRLTRDDFPLPTLSSRLQAYADELENGRGFAVLRPSTAIRRPTWLKMPNARTLAPEFPGRNEFPIPALA